MQVEWTTIQKIARTKAIDLWLLFPISGVIRTLAHEKIDATWKRRLNLFFGTPDWEQEFYKLSPETDMFDETRKTDRIVTIERVKSYFLKRLKKEFCGVSPNPKVLCNSHGHPLYLFCFAAGNPKGAKPALNIAHHILTH